MQWAVMFGTTTSRRIDPHKSVKEFGSRCLSDVAPRWATILNAPERLEWAMRFTIGLKIFGIAVGLLILMAAVALLSMRMTRIVDDQLVIIDRNYFPAYVALAQANIRSVEESAFIRRLLLAIAEQTDDTAKVDALRQRVAGASKASDERIADARRHINEQIADPLDFDDNVALARLDVRIESLQEERRRYEAVLSKLLAAAEAHQQAQANEQLAEL